MSNIGILCTSRGSVIVDLDEVFHLMDLIKREAAELGEPEPETAIEWRDAIKRAVKRTEDEASG